MTTLSLKGLKRNFIFTALLALLPLASPAQTAPMGSPTAPPSSDALASMEEDIQALQRQVGQLSLQVQSMQQDNDDLKKKILSQDELKATVANLIAASRAEIDKDIDRKTAQASDDSRKDILANVAKQMEALARDTNLQLEKLAHAIGTSPSTRPITVNAGPAPKFDKGIDYVVKRGDSFAKICLSNHVTSRDLLLANPQLNGNANHIVEGQHLFIPQKEGAPATSIAPTTSPSASSEDAPTAGAVLNFPKQ